MEEQNINFLKERIWDFEEEIRLMSKKKLLENFSAASSGKPKATIIIKNQIWQSFQRIQEGKETQFEGNIRSYWYSHIKPTLGRVDLLSGYDHYETMLDVFNRMVGKLGLFRYIDFGFDDDNWENRRIATKMPNLILFAEKTGWFRTLKELHEEFGMTIVALGGAPSWLSSEYLVQHLRKVTNLKQHFYLLSAVDYDPAGRIISNSFKEQLKRYGIHNSELVEIINLKNYKPLEIKMFKYPLPQKQKTKVEHWIKETGGIDGKSFGLEADSMSRLRFKEIVRETIKQLKLDQMA